MQTILEGKVKLSIMSLLVVWSYFVNGYDNFPIISTLNTLPLLLLQQQSIVVSL